MIAAASLCAHAALASAAPGFNLTRVADGVYVHVGRVEEASPENRGDIANIGFIVGAKCIAVVDTGNSRAVGEALRTALREVTNLPVCYVINTHVHPDHIFGNAAFVPEHPQFVGHAKLPAAMAARGPGYLRALARQVGPWAKGSELVAPTLTVADKYRLDLGGRSLLLRAWGTAHTDNDLTVYDESSGTLWTGDLLFVGHVPVVDGSLRGWLKVIAQLRALTPRHVIPGHGSIDPAWPQALDAEAQYLNVIATGVRAAIKRGDTLSQAVVTVGGSERGHWRLFDGFHRRNVTAAYAELEWED